LSRADKANSAPWPKSDDGEDEVEDEVGDDDDDADADPII